MFLGWSVGGEYLFGKGKRGLLLAIPLTLYGIGVLPWWVLAAQVGALYLIYQALFYDIGIGMVYENHDKLGWLVIGLNGAIIGLTTIAFSYALWSLPILLSGLAAGILGFIFAVVLSNSDKCTGFRAWLKLHGPQYLPYRDDAGRRGYYINFKDAWWVCEGITGMILAITLVVFKW